MFLLQADAGSPDWPAHRDVDALAFAVEAVGGALSFENLRKFWREARPRVEERLSEAR
jgi:hypothetical protein